MTDAVLTACACGHAAGGHMPECTNGICECREFHVGGPARSTAEELWPWLRHKMDCAKTEGYGEIDGVRLTPQKPCDCGLDAALANLDAAHGPAPAGAVTPQEWSANGLAALDHLDSLYYADNLFVADYRAATDAIRAALASSPAPAGLDVATAREVIASVWRQMNEVAFVSEKRPHGNLGAPSPGTETVYAGNFLATLNSLGYELVTRPAEEGPITDANGDELEHGEPDYPGQDA